MKQSNLKPNVVRGGAAIPIRSNMFYMKGRKHEQGGIDIGKNPKTGIEVEDGEVIQITPNETRVFSSEPFLYGRAPAEKVINGENPDKVIKQQESYKDRNGIKDDGTKMKLGCRKRAKYGLESKLDAPEFNKKYYESIRPNSTAPVSTKSGFFGNATQGDKIEAGVNVLGSIGSALLNSNFNKRSDRINESIRNANEALANLSRENINALEYADAPTPIQAQKLVTTHNINASLDEVDDQLARTENLIDGNTASSRVAQARKMRARSQALSSKNKLYQGKENTETDLMNRDLLNRQSVDSQNAQMRNAWLQGKTSFEMNKTNMLLNNENSINQRYLQDSARETALNRSKADNVINLIQGVADPILNYVDNDYTRDKESQALASYMLTHADVSPEKLKQTLELAKYLRRK